MLPSVPVNDRVVHCSLDDQLVPFGGHFWFGAVEAIAAGAGSMNSPAISPITIVNILYRIMYKRLAGISETHWVLEG